MTLRVEISIIPFGDELRKRVIQVINISRIETGNPNTYVMEVDEYKVYTDDNIRIRHAAEDGALELVRKALEAYLNG